MISKINTRARMLCGAAMLSFIAFTGAAHAEGEAKFDIRKQPLSDALVAFGVQSGKTIIAPGMLTASKTSRDVTGPADIDAALARLLEGTGLTYERSGEAFKIVQSIPRKIVAKEAATFAPSETVSGSAVEGLVVTAQKRREQIQDVPIAISAFSADALQAQKIEGGFDLLKAIPNVTFSKNNFSGYNFSIRGIGTKAISVTTDPGVAVEFNGTPLIRNRLFEQEYFDVERVEVLRGPQGTLHGRNATSGVINVISETPDLDGFAGSLKGELGNYSSRRLVGMVNVPLIENVLGVRFAGSMTERDGYGVNLYDGSDVDGRDLWSARMTIGFEPTDRIRADLIWERFEEDDNRQRTGKQLCTHDPGRTEVGGVVIRDNVPLTSLALSRSIFSQGCLPGSLYDDAAFGTPNGLAIPFIMALASPNIGTMGHFEGDAFAQANALITGVDPYGNRTQSRDLRSLYSQIESVYQANSDVLELNIDFDVTDTLTLTSQTQYSSDKIYATQDFNRYTTVPSFTDTLTVFEGFGSNERPSVFADLAPGGVFCDPQLGCSDTIVGQDLSRATSEQFAQEFRLQSNFDGPLNFSLGANFLRYTTVEDYYVFFNAATMAAIVSLNAGFFGSRSPERVTTDLDCKTPPAGGFGFICVPIENNPISEIQDYGHNYFLSRNPYKLQSKSVFGEAYWEATSTVKVTAGLRYTDDEKVFTPIPSQTALSPRDHPALLNAAPAVREFFIGLPFSGIGLGYPAEPDVKLGWQEVTGRVGVDWKPDLSFTDETMIYAFVSRGYKGGGMNPPPIGLNYEEAAAAGIIYTPSAPRNFEPEYVYAYEAGAKNTLLGGGLVLNTGVFYYDYEGYQVSKIVDRTAQNENFDAKVWGVEIESVFAPNENLRFNASLGYLDTRIADGSLSLDIMDRIAGHTDWVLVKPAMTLTSNCVMPAAIAALIMGGNLPYPDFMAAACPGGGILGTNYRNDSPFSTLTLPDGSTYDPADYPEAGYGAGFLSDVSGNELPNSPHFTISLGAQYGWDLFNGNWRATIRGDAYWQSQSWARVYELPIDKLHGWYNANLSVWLERPEDDLKFEFYVKNLMDDTPITDTFLNSDDTALTTNIFVLDPRLIGLSITKGF